MIPSKQRSPLMSLEYALEKFPSTLKLKDGLSVVVRPLNKRDETRLHRFLLAIPEEERLFIKQPVSDRALVREWCSSIDFHVNLPLLMLDGTKIAGQATIHQRSGGWRRHIGVVSVLTHPDYRGRNVAKLLVEEVVEVARHLGLKKLEARLNGERKVAIRALEQIGFQKLMSLPDYVLDMKGGTHDYVFMGMDLTTAEEFAGIG